MTYLSATPESSGQCRPSSPAWPGGPRRARTGIVEPRGEAPDRIRVDIALPQMRERLNDRIQTPARRAPARGCASR
jgi:hypothetical protein